MSITRLYTLHKINDDKKLKVRICAPTNHIWSNNTKYIWGPHGKPYGDRTLITYIELQKVYTLNKYNFPIFIYYKETIKKIVKYINWTFNTFNLTMYSYMII